MKLLFDQNISFRLIGKLSDLFPEAKQVRNLGLENSTDLQIFEFARDKGYTIVTFDADFCDLNNLKGFPVKIIWLKTGNTTTAKLEELFREKEDLIRTFLKQENGCLEISG